MTSPPLTGSDPTVHPTASLNAPPNANPFYLVSGVLMLAGCFLVSQAAHADPHRVAPVFWALGLLALYEGLVIALAGLLVHRLKQVRHAGHLLMIEALLLADVPLLFNELFLARPIAGGLLAGLGLSLALGKFIIVARVLGTRPRAGTLTLLGIALAIAYGTPGAMRWGAVVHVPLPRKIEDGFIVGRVV